MASPRFLRDAGCRHDAPTAKLLAADILAARFDRRKQGAAQGSLDNLFNRRKPALAAAQRPFISSFSSRPTSRSFSKRISKGRL